MVLLKSQLTDSTRGNGMKDNSYSYIFSASRLIVNFCRLFIIEGIPSVLLALVAAWYLPNTPETAKFLTDEEREIEIRRLAKGKRFWYNLSAAILQILICKIKIDQGAANDHSWSWPQVISVFTDYKTYTYMLIYITGTSALQGVTLFLPSIIKGMGSWSTAASQALTTPPYVAAFIFTNVAGWTSDKLFDRCYHLVVINIIGMAGFLMLMFVPKEQVGVQYFAACVATTAVVCIKFLTYPCIICSEAKFTPFPPHV